MRPALTTAPRVTAGRGPAPTDNRSRSRPAVRRAYRDRPIESLRDSRRPGRGFPAASRPRRPCACSSSAGYDACEIDFESGFWMEKRLRGAPGRSRRRQATSRSRSTRRSPRSSGTWTAARSSGARPACSITPPGLPPACGAELVVVHPGFLLGRDPRARSTPSVDAAGRSPRAARGEGACRALRDRDDGARPRARERRGRLRRRRPPRLGPSR